MKISVSKQFFQYSKLNQYSEDSQCAVQMLDVQILDDNILGSLLSNSAVFRNRQTIMSYTTEQLGHSNSDARLASRAVARKGGGETLS